MSSAVDQVQASHSVPLSPSAEPVDRAISLARELEGLLSDMGGEEPSYQLRLARAHALSTTDALRALVRPTSGEALAPTDSGVFNVNRSAKMAKI